MNIGKKYISSKSGPSRNSILIVTPFPTNVNSKRPACLFRQPQFLLAKTITCAGSVHVRRSCSECGLIEKLIIVFHGGKLSERLTRSVIFVLMLVALKFQIERTYVQVSAVKRIKLVAAGAVGAINTAVQLGRFGRQLIQRDFDLFTGRCELGHEFAATIDLDRLDLERHLLLEVLQKREAQSAVKMPKFLSMSNSFGSSETKCHDCIKVTPAVSQ